MKEPLSECTYNHNKRSHKHKNKTPVGEVIGTIPILSGKFESTRFHSVYARDRLIDIPIPVNSDDGSLLIRFIAPNGREQFVIAFEPDDEDGTQCELYFSDLPHRFGMVIDHVEGLH